MGDNYHSDIERVLGTPGNDQIVGSSHAEELNGAFGNDKILGGGGNDTLSGGADSDKVDGGPGKDSVYGDTSSCCASNGNDVITVQDGTRDSVSCGAVLDSVLADKGDTKASSTVARPSGVSRTSTPRRSLGSGSRSTRPRAASRSTRLVIVPLVTEGGLAQESHPVSAGRAGRTRRRAASTSNSQRLQVR